ncbi:MAG: valine--tRNA ligase [Candidatus Bipolaricaulota bacterium]|nr:valine--tRNA ligase [Candidatus Bipolaricaulota bacterium]
MELSKRYQPSQVEEEIYHFWDKTDFFRANIETPSKGPFSIVIPPPNVTGRLHMGHALNNTLQDIIIRYKRMDGYTTCWFPGTDHAGIATQNVVEKVLAKEGISRHEIGREAFVARVWEWKEKYGSEIIEQLKSLGCSCDWSRQRFTLDEGLSRAVHEAFVKLYDEGLIYRGNYMINWCPRCETALSDIEVEHKDVAGNLYYVNYQIKEGGQVTIATTRPETMLGDSGVAVNPSDKRHNHLIGKTAILPLLGRELPIVAAEEVDPEFGTGILKITPAHDPIDFAIGKRNKLAAINIFTKEGKITENGGRFAGMTREEAQKAVITALKEDGALENVVPYVHAVGHCQRCQTAVEPIVSTQWFVRMQPLAEEAIAAVRDGRVRFVPDRWKKLYFDWMENIHDWCISRQLWWGHRIPVWYGPDETPFAAHNEQEAQEKATKHYGHAVELRQEEDVLDTWFSSSLWPFSVMGWPEKTADLDYFYPSSLLMTGFDILFFWVSRMLMMGLHFTGKVPFPEVYITPLIVDANGQKMSKSKGNSIDPMDVKETYGMDALRFSLAQSTSKGRSMRLPQSLLDEARNFLNKVWNMSRFVLMNLNEERPELSRNLTALEDRFILSRLSAAVTAIRENLEDYNFNLAVEALYAFVWHDFCDWYLEMAKERLAGDDQQVRSVLYHTLREIVKLLHPFVPFISERLWQTLGEEPTSVGLAAFPKAGERAPEAEAQMAIFQEAVRAVRAIRAELSVPQNAVISVLVRTDDPKLTALIGELQGALCTLCGADEWLVATDINAPEGSARQVISGADLFVPLANLIDIDAERKRIAKDLSQVKSDLERTRKNLANESFLSHAPAEVVEKERGKEQEFLAKAERLQANLASLEG